MMYLPEGDYKQINRDGAVGWSGKIPEVESGELGFSSSLDSRYPSVLQSLLLSNQGVALDYF